MPEVDPAAEVRHGLDAVEDYRDEQGGDGILPFDPREKGPKQVFNDTRRWVSDNSLKVLVAAAAVFALLHFFGAPKVDLPIWTDVAVVSGLLAIGAGYPIGKRVGRFFATPQYRLVDQMDAKSGDQDIIKISIDRWQDLRVIDHEGNERGREYLHDKVINGESAVEVDRYYPVLNTAIASWQAGATNQELRKWEKKVDMVKTDLEKEANEALEARVNAEEKAREQAMQTSNYVLAVTEGVLQPGQGALSDRLEELTKREETETHEDLLSGLEEQLVNGNGHEEDTDVDTDESGRLDLDAVRQKGGQVLMSLDPRNGGDNDDE